MKWVFPFCFFIFSINIIIHYLFLGRGGLGRQRAKQKKRLKKKKSITAVTMVAVKGKLDNGVSFGLIVSLCQFSLPRYLKVTHEMHVSIPFVILTEDKQKC